MHSIARPTWRRSTPLCRRASISDTDRAKVIELRAQGEELHAAGKHQESIDTLAQAKQILGI